MRRSTRLGAAPRAQYTWPVSLGRPTAAGRHCAGPDQCGWDCCSPTNRRRLDTRTSHQIMETRRGSIARQGVTVIVVTHQADIAAYTDRTDDAAAILSPTCATRSRSRLPNRPGRRRGRQKPVGCAAAVSHCPAHQYISGLRGDDHGCRHAGRSGQYDAIGIDDLGVFIGVAALIAMVAVGQGANDACASRSKASAGARTTWGRHARGLRDAPALTRDARRRSGAKARPSARSAT